MRTKENLYYNICIFHTRQHRLSGFEVGDSDRLVSCCCEHLSFFFWTFSSDEIFSWTHLSWLAGLFVCHDWADAFVSHMWKNNSVCSLQMENLEVTDAVTDRSCKLLVMAAKQLLSQSVMLQHTLCNHMRVMLFLWVSKCWMFFVLISIFFILTFIVSVGRI